MKTLRRVVDKVTDAIPFYGAWLYGAEIFVELLPSTRILHLEGSFGSGKTVTAVFLAALLRDKGLVARIISNLHINGKDPVYEEVPQGKRYISPYLYEPDGVTPKTFYGGQQLPLEDTAIVWDEAGLYLKNNKLAEDVMTGLRKTNLYVLMPSVLRPVAKLTAFVVRRSTNWYKMGIPAWEYSWAMMQGRDGVVKGKFYLWRPDRLFGIAQTQGFPTDDGGILDGISYTLGLDKVRRGTNSQVAKRQIASYDLGASEIYGAAQEFADVFRNASSFQQLATTSRRR